MSWKSAFFANMKGWERLGLAATIVATVVGVPMALFTFFFYPSYHEMMAFPTAWSQGDGANTVTIHQTGDQIREQGELTFLLLDVPYTADFQCLLKKASQGLWEGKCLYQFKSAGGNSFSCSVTTNEEITSLTSKSITGFSQPLEDPHGPNQCPTPQGGPSGRPTVPFALSPK
jgi:hypothetical protein